MVSFAGKLTAALQTARQLLSSWHWESVYWADLSCCRVQPSVTFALLSAFGLASLAPEVNHLQVKRC